MEQKKEIEVQINMPPDNLKLPNSDPQAKTPDANLMLMPTGDVVMAVKIDSGNFVIFGS